MKGSAMIGSVLRGSKNLSHHHVIMTFQLLHHNEVNVCSSKAGVTPKLFQLANFFII